MVPIGVALNVAFGASVILVNRKAAVAEGPVRSTALAALLCVELMVFAPICTYLLARYPDWMLMYLATPADVPLPFWGWVALYPIAALIGFWVTRHLVVRGKSLAAWGVLFGALVLGLGVLAFGYEEFSSVGTTDSFQRRAGMQPLAETPLAYLLAAAFTAAVAAWLATLWRLTIYGRAMILQDGDVVDETMVKDGDKSDGKSKKKRKS